MAVIGFDVDGVVAEFVRPYIKLLNSLSDLQLPDASYDYPTTWDFAERAGVEARDIKEAWRQITTTSFFANLLPMNGARSVLRTLKCLEHEGHNVYFITARPGPEAKVQTEAWLDVWGFSRATVLIAAEKGPLAKALKLDYFVDDKPENCLDVYHAIPTCAVYMNDQPYNREGPAGFKVKSAWVAVDKIWEDIRIDYRQAA